jgi:hypothetical protein
MEKHIIHKVYLELTTSSVVEAQKLKDSIGGFLNSEVFPLLEKQIDTIDNDTSAYAIQLDQVHVEITEKEIRLNDNLKYTLVKKIEEEAQKVIKTIDDEQKQAASFEKKGKRLYKNEHELETFIHFLKTGTNPWWSNASITKLLAPKKFKELLATRDFTQKITRVLRNKRVRDRVMNQLTKESVKALCIAIAAESSILPQIDDVIIQQIKKRPVVQQQEIWREVLFAIGYQETVDIVALIANVKDKATPTKDAEKKKQQDVAIAQKAKRQQLEEEIKNTKNTEKTDQIAQELAAIDAEIAIEREKAIKEKLKGQEYQEIESIPETAIQYTQNAGLVLVHPFLTHFFSHCGLLDENKQLMNPELCVHLLHYIATGKTKQAESDMAFEKFLCDIPLYKTINRDITITKKQKEQVHNLLNAVNENWGALKTSSHALLRNEFLQRLGKIEKNSSGITILMEGKTQDILLRKLSWGMGLIRLPWKKEFIYVNW